VIRIYDGRGPRPPQEGRGPNYKYVFTGATPSERRAEMPDARRRRRRVPDADNPFMELAK